MPLEACPGHGRTVSFEGWAAPVPEDTKIPQAPVSPTRLEAPAPPGWDQPLEGEEAPDLPELELPEPELHVEVMEIDDQEVWAPLHQDLPGPPPRKRKMSRKRAARCLPWGGREKNKTSQ